MLDYFKRLFAYNAWAQEKVLATLEAMDPKQVDESLLKVTSHILTASQTWLSRLMVVPPMDMSKSLTLVECRELFESLKKNWKNYLEGLSEEDLMKKKDYQNTKGVAFENNLSDILAHLVNHSTYHRGQIASLIKKAGTVPPVTDFIAYVRQ